MKRERIDAACRRGPRKRVPSLLWLAVAPPVVLGVLVVYVLTAAQLPLIVRLLQAPKVRPVGRPFPEEIIGDSDTVLWIGAGEVPRAA